MFQACQTFRKLNRIFQTKIIKQTSINLLKQKHNDLVLKWTYQGMNIEEKAKRRETLS